MHLGITVAIARRGLRAIPAWAWPALLGAALLAGGLDEGFWEPTETRVADAALRVERPEGPDLTRWCIGAGLRLLGPGELGGRLPLALCGLGCLLLVHRLGSRLASPRAGLLSALILATTPAFLFQSRQLDGDSVYGLALLAAVGGGALLLWEGGSGRGRRAALLALPLAAAGLVAALLARGLLAGIGLPLAILGLAAGLHRPTRLTRARALVLAAGVALSAGAILAGLGPSLRAWLPTSPPGELTLAGPLRELLDGFFPWTGLLALALPALLSPSPESESESEGERDGGRERDEARSGPGRALVVCALLVCYAALALAPGWFGALRPATLAWLALAVGIAVDEAWTRRTLHPLAALCAAGLIVALQLDLSAAPGSLLMVHLPLSADHAALRAIRIELRLAGLTLAGLSFIALAGPPLPIQLTTRRRLLGPLLRRATWLLNLGGRLLGALIGAPPRSWLLFGGLALTFAGWSAYRLLPELGRHLSDKALVQRYLSCRRGAEPLYLYGASGAGAGGAPARPSQRAGMLRRPGELLTTLRGSGRAFILLPVGELGRLEHAARSEAVVYHVLDARSSRYLLISNRLGGTCAEDHTPLRRALLASPPRPRRRLAADFEGRVRLLGHDLPARLRRGGSSRITLYLQVLSALPADYKVFIHLDGAGGRIHGDHAPVGGVYPTQYWRAGDFIADTHEVELPLLTTASGRYTVYVGFWRGEQRLRVTAGPQDGVDRVRLAVVEIR